MAKRKPTSRPRERPPAPAAPPRRPPRVRSRTPGRAGAALVEAGRTLRRSWFVVLAIGVVGFGVYSGVRSVRDQQRNDFTAQRATAPSERPTTAAPAPPPKIKPLPVADVFAQQCGVCHTLRAAKSRGGIGPDLDRASGLTAGRVRAQIANGSPDGAMPPGILTGADADRVSRFVAREGGRRARG